LTFLIGARGRFQFAPYFAHCAAGHP